MESKIYNQKGKAVGDIKLPESVFGLNWNADLVHQVITSLMSSIRKPVAHSKTRGEVSGGGKKPWRQKGTGRARHGSTRSPIWVGGGVSHGPRNDKNFLRTVSKKMKAKALFTILSRKLKDNEIIFVDELNVTEPKTKKAVEILNAFESVGLAKTASKKKNCVQLVLPGKNVNVGRSFSNLAGVSVDEWRNLNPIDVMTYKYLIIVSPEKAVEFLNGKMAK